MPRASKWLRTCGSVMVTRVPSSATVRTPVAVTGALLIALGFRPLEASGLSLIANTAPVAFGALGTPIIALQGVTGLDLHDLSAMVGRQLPLFSLIVPFWVVWAFAGFKGMKEVWPAILVTAVGFTVSLAMGWGLATAVDPWLAALIVAVVVLVIGGILAAVGASKAKNAAPPMPAHAVDSVRADVAAAKGAMQ